MSHLRTIKSNKFLKSLGNSLCGSIGINSKEYGLEVKEKNIFNDLASVKFETPQIIEEEWVKRKIFSSFREFYIDKEFNVEMEETGEFTLKRTVTNPTNLEHFKEEYSAKIEISENLCRVCLTDMLHK
jgi:hypothetical protein